MEIDRVLIDDCQYGIFSLSRDQRILNLAGEHGFYLLRVHGNSMNKAKPISIENGDYVLMRAQKTADTGDIVAAEVSSIDNQDNQATLKRFLRSQDGKVYF
jgi:repressor LexA